MSRGALWTARVLNALAVLQPTKCGSAVILSVLLALAPIGTAAQSNDAVTALAQREKQPLLDTLKALVEIESGSADIEGVPASAR